MSAILDLYRVPLTEAEFASTWYEVMRGTILTTQKLKRREVILTNPAIVPMIAALPLRSEPALMSSASNSNHQITAMLRAWRDGDHEVSNELIGAVYHQLRRQARRQLRHERRHHTLDTAALINEAYLKLVEQRNIVWEDRGHFFALAAELMRRILVDHARTRQRQKRGGVLENLPLDDVGEVREIALRPLDTDLIALDEALERLAGFDEQQVKVVELRFFAGLDVSETAEALKISKATVRRDWAAAKAWLKYELTRGSRP